MISSLIWMKNKNMRLASYILQMKKCWRSNAVNYRIKKVNKKQQNNSRKYMKLSEDLKSHWRENLKSKEYVWAIYNEICNITIFTKKSKQKINRNENHKRRITAFRVHCSSSLYSYSLYALHIFTSICHNEKKFVSLHFIFVHSAIEFLWQNIIISAYGMISSFIILLESQKQRQTRLLHCICICAL